MLLRLGVLARAVGVIETHCHCGEQWQDAQAHDRCEVPCAELADLGGQQHERREDGGDEGDACGQDEQDAFGLLGHTGT